MQPDYVNLMLKHKWMTDVSSFLNAWIKCADVLSVILLKSMLEKQNAEREEAVLIIWNGMQNNASSLAIFSTKSTNCPIRTSPASS